MIVRPVPEGYYEIISGHRRKFATKQLGYTKVPVIIKVMKNDEAIVAMVDSNLQREYISPSEKAHAYKMRYDVMKKKGNTNVRGRVVHKIKGKRTVEILAEEFGESTKQIQRYLKLTELIPELLTKLDDDQLSISAAVEIAFLKDEEQKWFLEAMDYVSANEAVVSDIIQVAKADSEERQKIISCTFVVTTILLTILDILSSIDWNVQDLSLTARVPFIAIIPGAIMVLYGIVCKIRGKKTYGICAIGISLLLIPIIVIGAAFLICALMTG